MKSDETFKVDRRSFFSVDLFDGTPDLIRLLSWTAGTAGLLDISDQMRLFKSDSMLK